MYPYPPSSHESLHMQHGTDEWKYCQADIAGGQRTSTSLFRLRRCSAAASASPRLRFRSSRSFPFLAALPFLSPPPSGSPSSPALALAAHENTVNIPRESMMKQLHKLSIPH